MSVPKHKRNESKLDVQINAENLRDAVYVWCIKDFGYNKYPKFIKILNSNIEQYIKQFSEADKFLMPEDTNKFIQANYPDWFIKHIRTQLLDYCDDLVVNIISANAIYPRLTFEIDLRRMYQDKAQAAIAKIQNKFNQIINTMPELINRYGTIRQLILRQNSLLKGWKASDVRLRKDLIKSELTITQDNI